jgi:hypothetical protein
MCAETRRFKDQPHLLKTVLCCQKLNIIYNHSFYLTLLHTWNGKSAHHMASTFSKKKKIVFRQESSEPLSPSCCFIHAERHFFNKLRPNSLIIWYFYRRKSRRFTSEFWSEIWTLQLLGYMYYHTYILLVKRTSGLRFFMIYNYAIWTKRMRIFSWIFVCLVCITNIQP